MKKLVIATGNQNKVREIRAILAPFGIEVVSATDCGGMPDVVEDGDTFVANAAKKAIAGARAFGQYVLADDSGLAVDALDGAPGVYSARYAGEGGNDGRNVAKLLDNLTGVDNRAARFVCAMVIASPDGKVVCESIGKVEGRIATEVHGTGGFGYDPVFFPDGYDATFGELPSEVKNRISHRANALQVIVAWLKQQA